jgi:hypothetical protein
VASWIETFQCPMSEIEERFTRSELAVVAWRSQETYHQMSAKMKKHEQNSPGQKYDERGVLPEGLPDKFFNEAGEVDLRQVTGAEAWKFMQAQGIKLPIIPVQERPPQKK